MAYSQYAQGLESVAKARYQSKIVGIGLDPYTIPREHQKSVILSTVEELPDLTYHDIYNYFVNTPSCLTGEALKAYKSLEAYKYFTAGFVREILACLKEETFIITSKVLHSQRLYEKPLEVWVTCHPEGTILTGHCTCMAGLGEACSHMAATMFAVDNLVKMKKETSCTSLPNSWLPPSSSRLRAIPVAPTSEMDFTNAKKRYQQLSQHPEQRPQKPSEKLQTTEEEKKSFYEALHASGYKSVILSVVPEYSDSFNTSRSLLPEPLTQLYNVDNTKLPFEKLVDKAQEVFDSLSVTVEEASKVEEVTKTQSSSKAWFRQRSGRITASKMKAACRTDPISPSPSLIKGICYPESYTFTTKGTRWGCDHEDQARKIYECYMKDHHTDFNVSESGLFIDPSYPHLGATPDGLVSCSCCGEGVIEVKCPHCLSEKNIPDLVDNPKFCLISSAEGKYQLSRDHQYYYQVQTQIRISNRAYCDFIVWCPESVLIERILPDPVFWDQCSKRASRFYIQGVLPELLGKWYTLNPRSVILDTTVIDLSGTYCYCRQGEAGSMIMCASPTCNIKVFHVLCLGLKNVPKRKWLCPGCRTLAKALKDKP